MMKKYWKIVLLVLLVLVVLAAVFWNSIIVRIAPKLVLSGAITELVSGLESRYQAGPARILLQSADPEGKYTVQMDLNTSNALLGDIDYNMTVLLESNPKKVLAEGSVIHSGKTVGLRVYMDSHFAAVSSPELLQGNFYGITYDTFAEDIQKNALLAYVIGDKKISEWDESLASLQDTMQTVRDVPDYSQLDMGNVLYGVLALKAQVSSGVSDSGQKCHVISFEATGAQIKDAIDRYLPNAAAQIKEKLKPLTDQPDSNISVSFWLTDRKIVQIELKITQASETLTLKLCTGKNPETDDLILFYAKSAPGASESYEVQVSTEYNGEVYAEKIAVLSVEEEIRNRTVLDYSWNRSDGELVLDLTQGGEDTSLQMDLTQTADGFRISTNQFETLIGMLNDTKKTGNSVCTMTVTKGAELETPVYKNFDQWTLEDFFLLIKDIGSLIGFNL